MPLTCAGCGAEIKQGGLCRRCVGVLRARLAEVPRLLAQLRINIAKQSRLVGQQEGSGHTGGPKPLPLDLKAVETAREYEEAFVKAARRHGIPVTGDKDGHRGALTCAQYLQTQVPRLAREGGAGVALTLRELEDAAGRVWRRIDRPPETWYAGPCPGGRDDERGEPDPCGQDLLAVPGAERVRCRRCRRVWRTAERRDVLLAAMYDYRARAVWIASVLTPILDRNITPQSIYRLVNRGVIVPAGADAEGHPLYRIGDVSDELETRWRRRVALLADRQSRPLPGA